MFCPWPDQESGLSLRARSSSCPLTVPRTVSSVGSSLKPVMLRGNVQYVNQQYL